MDRKSKGKAVLTESDTGFDYSPVGLSILVVDHDQKCLQEVVTNLRKFTECNQVEEALTLLRMDFSGFDIIITGQRMLGISEFELFRIGRERGLPVVVTSEDDGVDTIQRSLDYGACAYMEKPIPMRDLNMVWTHVYSSRKNKLAQVQKPANDMSRAKKCRMSWKMDIQEKFVESVQEMGIDKATPKKVLERMKTKGVRNVSRDQVSSHLQKHRLKLQKQAPPLHMQEYKDKDGTSSGHVESRYEMEHPPMTLLNGFLNTPDPNQLDISSQQQRAPAAIKNTHGFPNLPLPVEANFCTIEGSTICGNQRKTLMTQMTRAPLSEQICNQLTGHQPFIYHLPNDVPANVLVNEIRKMKSALEKSDNTSCEFPAGMRVLIVDENLESLHLLETMLKQCDYEVAKCNRGKDALSLLKNSRSNTFDIILTERCLPDMDEITLLGKLSKATDLPVIIMSEVGDNSTMVYSIKYGACYYLVKPIRMDELKKIWIHVLKHRIKATPNKILNRMKAQGVQCLTREHVSSYLQKYRKKQLSGNDEVLNTKQLELSNIGTQAVRNVAFHDRSSITEGSTIYGNRSDTFMAENVAAMGGKGPTYFPALELSNHDNFLGDNPGDSAGINLDQLDDILVDYDANI
nr:two-component response regulator orr21 [Quercus suber]